MAPLQPKGSHFGLILPLCTSSATIGLAAFQYPVFAAFLGSQKRIHGSALSAWWEAYLPGSAGLVAPTSLTTSIAGLLCYRWLRNHSTLETTAVSQWYLYGSIFAAGHLLLAPMVAGRVTSIINAAKRVEASGSGNGLFKPGAAAAAADDDDETTEVHIDEHNRNELRAWLTWHTVRFFVADLPAVWCFAEGVALSFWVV